MIRNLQRLWGDARKSRRGNEFNWRPRWSGWMEFETGVQMTAAAAVAIGC